MNEDRKIIAYPNKILLANSHPVERINQYVRDILDEMVRITIMNNGIGLAAPQIEISKRLITVFMNKKLYKIINPEIARKYGKQVVVEGCLSIPNELYEISRAEEVVVQDLHVEGKEVCLLVNNLLASVFQHEIDHLDGILINSKGKH